MVEVLEGELGVGCRTGTGEPVNVQRYFHLIALRIFGQLSMSHDYAACKVHGCMGARAHGRTGTWVYGRGVHYNESTHTVHATCYMVHT